MIFFALIPFLLIVILLRDLGTRFFDWFSDVTQDDHNILALVVCLFLSALVTLIWRWMARKQAPV